MERHAGASDPGRGTERYMTVLVGSPGLRHFRDDYLMAQLLIDLYAVEGVWVPAYVLSRGKMGRALEISGAPTRVQVAVYAHDFVRGFIRREWRRYEGAGGGRRRARRDFAGGILEGFRAKTTTRGAARPPSAEGAVVAIDDTALNAYLRHRYPRLRRFRRSAGHHDASAFAAGLRTGAELVIHEGIARPAGAASPARLPAAGSGDRIVSNSR